MLTVVLLEAVGAVTFEAVLLIVVGEAVLSVLFEVVAVGAAVVHAARTIMLIVMTMLKIVFRFIVFLHL